MTHLPRCRHAPLTSAQRRGHNGGVPEARHPTALVDGFSGRATHDHLKERRGARAAGPPQSLSRATGFAGLGVLRGGRAPPSTTLTSPSAAGAPSRHHCGVRVGGARCPSRRRGLWCLALGLLLVLLRWSERDQLCGPGEAVGGSGRGGGSLAHDGDLGRNHVFLRDLLDLESGRGHNRRPRHEGHGLGDALAALAAHRRRFTPPPPALPPAEIGSRLRVASGRC
mmetsp:Transcript_112363/g.323024  ORF Transcript_112363/g.323024 Transcript_112363/m.323024 type:complete len:225 (-) Transcript_112363:29-703(-)